MRCAKEEYVYLYAFCNEPNHTYSEYEKLALFKKFFEIDKLNLMSIKIRNAYYPIKDIKIWIGGKDYNQCSDLMIAYTLGGFWSTQIEDENEICIGPNSSKKVYLL